MATSGDDAAAKTRFVWDINRIFPQKAQPADQHERLASQFQNVGLESKPTVAIPKDSGKSLAGGSGNSSMQQHPTRSDAKDCLFFVHTGSCTFGSACRFNHPVPVGKGKASEILSQIPCKFYLAGVCKNGESCRFSHSISEAEPEPLQLNVLGLPFRLGEMECSFYMRTGMCGYGTACKFHHPDPIFYEDPQQYGSFASDEPAEYLDGSSGITDGGYIMQFTESAQPYYPSSSMIDSSFRYQQPNYAWQGYQSTDTRTALQHEKVPERTQEMEPYFAPPVVNVLKCTQVMTSSSVAPAANAKTDDDLCKDLPPKREPCVLSDVGLPLRPGKKACWYYENLGLCKFGRVCVYDHPPKHSSNVPEGSKSKSASGGKTPETQE